MLQGTSSLCYSLAPSVLFSLFAWLGRTCCYSPHLRTVDLHLLPWQFQRSVALTPKGVNPQELLPLAGQRPRKKMRVGNTSPAMGQLKNEKP